MYQVWMYELWTYQQISSTNFDCNVNYRLLRRGPSWKCEKGHLKYDWSGVDVLTTYPTKANNNIWKMFVNSTLFNTLPDAGIDVFINIFFFVVKIDCLSRVRSFHRKKRSVILEDVGWITHTVIHLLQVNRKVLEFDFCPHSIHF